MADGGRFLMAFETQDGSKILVDFENNEQKKLYESLKIWRTDKARELKLPPYTIFHNLALFQISKYKPSTKMDLMMKLVMCSHGVLH